MKIIIKDERYKFGQSIINSLPVVVIEYICLILGYLTALSFILS